DEAANQLFLKVVNPNTTDYRTTINLKNASASRVSGTASVLTSANISNENSFASPNYIVPVNSAIDTLGSALNYTFKANSVTVLKLNTATTSGVSTIKANGKQLSFFPNPTRDFVYFKDAGVDIISFQVRNVTGQTVLQDKTTNGKADLSSLQPGIYLLTAHQGNQIVSGKVVKK
ncbi:MAG: T9SS type A sorting domain-containing protein, partial [Bacteroidota bacterium]|nr:T9SS type A sorting domain-containing protein [Bacteroidota bacterium]